ncbi:hypothetical protein HYS48_01900 [Candidatus Woesearchaeota archaeon]|nr:hypothetical protein [Candidatus Woesearchaeota archaeon]
MKRTVQWLAVLFVVLFLAGCGESTGEAAEQEAIEVPLEEQSAANTTPGNETNATEEVVLIKRPSITPETAREEAFQIARGNIITVALGSALGIPFSLKEEQLEKILKAGELENPPIKNWALLERPFSTGNPKLLGKESLFYPSNYESFRFSSLSQRTEVKDFANAILAEAKLAKALLAGYDADAKFQAALLGISAARKANVFALDGKSGGFYFPMDEAGELDDSSFALGEQLYVLLAFSEIKALTEEKQYFGEFRKTEAIGYANQLYNIIKREEKQSNYELFYSLDSHDLGMAVYAFASFAGITDDGKWQQFALEDMGRIANIILERMDDNGKMEKGMQSQLTTQATAVLGLLIAFENTDNEEYKQGAIEAWSYLQELWDENAQLYRKEEDGDFAYSAEEIADVILAFNAVTEILGTEEGERMADFFNSAVKLSGIQLSEMEDDTDEIPSTEENFLAPVFATGFAYDEKKQEWRVTDKNFNTGQAMYLAAQLLNIGTYEETPALEKGGLPKLFSLE